MQQHPYPPIDPQDLRDLRTQVNTISQEVAKGEKAHENLKEMLGNHIIKDDKWKEDMGAQVSAIANALLQDKGRDDAEKEAEQKSEARNVEKKHKWLTWKTTVAVCAFAVIANIGEIVKFLAKLFSLLAE